MNWSYVSGFFDADGSITLANPGNSKYKTVYLTFHNNQRDILEKIRDYIELELGIKGWISEKKPKSINHQISYDLKYDYLKKVVLIIDELDIYHHKKIHRFEIVRKLSKAIPKNGKYNSELFELRKSLESEFYSTR